MRSVSRASRAASSATRLLCWNSCPLACFFWAGAECQEHSSEYSGEEWAAGHEEELGCRGQAGREPDQCCAKR